MANTQDRKRVDYMKQKTFDVEGLSDEQIALIGEYILKIKKAQAKETSLQELRAFLWQGANESNVLSEEKANRLAKEAISQVRNQ